MLFIATIRDAIIPLSLHTYSTSKFFILYFSICVFVALQPLLLLPLAGLALLLTSSAPQYQSPATWFECILLLTAFLRHPQQPAAVSLFSTYLLPSPHVIHICTYHWPTTHSVIIQSCSRCLHSTDLMASFWNTHCPFLQLLARSTLRL